MGWPSLPANRLRPLSTASAESMPGHQAQDVQGHLRVQHHPVAARGQLGGLELALALLGRLPADGLQVQGVRVPGHVPMPGGLAVPAVLHRQFDAGRAGGGQVVGPHPLLGEQQAGAGAVGPGGLAHRRPPWSEALRASASRAMARWIRCSGVRASPRRSWRLGRSSLAGGIRLADPGVLVAQGGQLPGLGEQLLEVLPGEVGAGGDAGAQALGPGAQHPHPQAAPLAGGEVLQGAVLDLGPAAAGDADEGLGPLGAQGQGMADALLEALLQGFAQESSEDGSDRTSGQRLSEDFWWIW